MNYLITTARIIADLKDMKLPGIWDISPNNVILQKEGRVKLTDYTEMRYATPVRDLHYFIYVIYKEFCEIRYKSSIYDILPEMTFSADPLINKRVKELLASMNEKVTDNSYKDDVRAYIEDLEQVRDVLAEDKHQNPNAPNPPVSTQRLQQSV